MTSGKISELGIKKSTLPYVVLCLSVYPLIIILHLILLQTHEIQCIPLNDERIAFGMLKALNF